jgi:hypothetical protein
MMDAAGFCEDSGVVTDNNADFFLDGGSLSLVSVLLLSSCLSSGLLSGLSSGPMTPCTLQI